MQVFDETIKKALDTRLIAVTAPPAKPGASR
jgi:hypothetical protein